MGILVNESQIGGGGTSNSSRNIGDIFYTTRTDNSLNGAVECNGSQYNFSDFDSNLQALFDDGKLPYLPIGKFDEMVTNQGGCDSFGYGTTDDLVLYPVEVNLGSSEEIQFYTNVSDWSGAQKDINGVLQGVKLYDKNTYQELVGWYVKYESIVGLYYIYNSEDEEQNIDGYWPYPGRDTVTIDGEFHPTSYFKVPKKLSRVLVRTQKPTADNNYTWYNVYADGWVEQGGTVKGGFSQSINWSYRNVSLPIKMIDNSYINTFQATWNFSYGGQVGQDKVYATTSSTATTMQWAYILFSSATSMFVNWQVSGYAAPSEYTKDKWNYQNIQVERCMVQLFNSTTDTAVATCNQVLADVSVLNQGDYVVYWDSYELSDHSHAYTGITLDEYQWYRIYKSGWVEQGGFNRTNGSNATRITIPVEMKTVNYTPVIQGKTEENGYTNAQWQVMPVNNTTSSTTTTSFVAQGSITGYNLGFRWQVSGFSFLA